MSNIPTSYADPADLDSVSFFDCEVNVSFNNHFDGMKDATVVAYSPDEMFKTEFEYCDVEESTTEEEIKERVSNEFSNTSWTPLF